MKNSVKEAKETKIFTINYVSENRKAVDASIEESNLYDFVMKSAEETTSPRGIENKLHIKEVEKECDCCQEDGDAKKDCEKCEGYGFIKSYDVYCWGFSGHGRDFVASFETEEEAEDEIFSRTYDYDFCSDDSRSTWFSTTIEEAQVELIQALSEIWHVDIDVVSSILNHKEIANQLRIKKEAISNEKRKIESEKESERINSIASIYSKMIDKIEGETYKETCTRLSQTIGQKIEGKDFHKAVQLSRV